ncbi:MAG: ABC transporter ATP-binding protein [Myxococcota bacterium]
MASVTLQAIHKRYGNVHVVRGIDLHIPAGARCVLLGASGCGKTTTLRMVAGLESPDEGRLLLDDRVVSAPRERVHVPPEERGLGMVFQSYALWPHLSVFENVAYPLRRARVPDGELRTRVREALALVHLESLGDRAPHALSGGQQQRVALARALVGRPQVLLTDEPLSNLDAKLRDLLRSEIAALCERFHITLLHVTHDQAEALSLGTHVAVMDAGRIAQLGPPEEVYRAPRTLLVARFLGDTHVLRASYDGEQVKVGGVAVRPRLAETGAPGEACALCVRPEDLRVESAGVEGAVPGRVLVSACVGEGWLLDVETEAGAVRVRAPSPARAGENVGVRVLGGHAFHAAA